MLATADRAWHTTLASSRKYPQNKQRPESKLGSAVTNMRGNRSRSVPTRYLVYKIGLGIGRDPSSSLLLFSRDHVTTCRRCFVDTCAKASTCRHSPTQTPARIYVLAKKRTPRAGAVIFYIYRRESLRLTTFYQNSLPCTGCRTQNSRGPLAPT